MISKALVVGAYHRKLEEMAALGLRLDVVIPAKWGSRRPEITEGRNYTIHLLPVRFSGKNHFHIYPGLSSLFRVLSPDLLHIDEESYSAVTFQAIRCARRRSVPSVFFNWQNILKSYPFPFSSMERYAFRHAAGALAGNEEARAVLQRKGCRLPVSVIPQFGVDPDIFARRDASEFRARLFGPGDFRIIGFGGRLVEEKGIRTLLEAFRGLKPDARLLFAGSGPMESEVRHLAGEAGNRIRILGDIPSGEMPSVLNCLDCLVLPSETRSNWKEQFGRILIEAMACEVPVVGSDSGEIPNVIGTAGVVFPEKNAGALRTVLSSLLSDPSALSTLGRSGRARVLSCFTQQIIARRTIGFYESLLGETANGHHDPPGKSVLT